MIRACLISVVCAFVLVGVCGGTENPEVPPAAKRDVDFVKDIKPIFKEHCLKCHGPNKQRGDFRLDEKAAALKGGESFAPAIIPGKGDESPLVRFAAGVVEGMEMPPEGEKRLSKDQVGLLRAWIDQGAKWPDDAPKQNPTAEHWSFQPLTRPHVPTVSGADASWAQSPIDPFIAVKLQDLSGDEGRSDSARLAPSPEANRPTLIRRAYLDLIGLPVPIEEVVSFVDDSRPDAYERLIDRLLASPHFGERWARHWLDVVKFAESDGFETNQPRPNAWPYRDYIIRSFNEDKPFDRFLFEQIAGDTIGVDEATGFLVAGAWDRVKSPDPGLTAQQRADELHDMVSTTGSALMGLTVGCARCHNHKFDPVSQADYYSIKAVFAGVQHGERPLKPADAEQRSWNLDSLRARLNVIDNELTRFEPLANVGGAGSVARNRSSVTRRTNVERFLPVRAKFVRFVIEATTGSEPCIDELEVFETITSPDAKPRNVARSSLGTIATSSSNLPGFEIHQLPFVNDGRYGNSASWISNEPGRGWVMLEFAESVEIDRILWSRDRPENGQFQDRIPTKYRIEAGMTIDSLKVVASSDDRMPLDGTSTAPPDFSWLNPEDRVVAIQLSTERQSIRLRLQSISSQPMVYAGRFAAPEPTFRLHRGDPMQKREAANPGGLSAFGANWKLDETTPDSDRRTALANWIISSEHPLTTRVIANRLWQHHFGQGIVATPSDFGRNGVLPSHPDLLNWLAAEIHRNSSLKRIHRSMVTSAAYRQSSQANDAGMARDATSRLFWRYPPRRLEAEAIRDNILAVAGNLDDRMYGAGFDLFEPNTNYVKVYNSKREFGPAEWRRMIYQAKPRMQLDEIFGQFDCPDAGQITPRRTSSITSLQALNLLNSRFIIQQSARFARRLRDEAGDDPSKQMRHAFELAFQRNPAEEELAAAIDLVQSHGLEAACRALLNANEFLFVF